VIITKGERVSFENGKLLSIPNSNSLKPEWTSGELAFVNETLSAILEEMERQFKCTIENKNDSNPQLFTGTLPSDNLEESLQIISSIYHLKYKKVANHKIILEHLNVEE
jgi:ferric-dicitrate binding protein FerR (iron transport regulator)